MEPEQTETETPETESLSGGELVYRATDPEMMHFRDDENGPPILEGRMMPYDEWTEIRSTLEGHFMERFAPGALAKTMQERGSKVRAMFEHGLDNVLGRQMIADIDEMRDEPDGAYYRATLLDGLPQLLVSGIRRGLYGSSVRYKPIKFDRVKSPVRSEHNPDGIPEVTVREAFLKEFSVTPFPAYAGATAGVRSLTDEIAARQLLGDPKRLLEIINESEPPHSPPTDEPEAPVSVGSRRTQPPRDYLRPQEDDSSWRL